MTVYLEAFKAYLNQEEQRKKYGEIYFVDATTSEQKIKNEFNRHFSEMKNGEFRKILFCCVLPADVMNNCSNDLREEVGHCEPLLLVKVSETQQKIVTFYHYGSFGSILFYQEDFINLKKEYSGTLVIIWPEIFFKDIQNVLTKFFKEPIKPDRISQLLRGVITPQVGMIECRVLALEAFASLGNDLDNMRVLDCETKTLVKILNLTPGQRYIPESERFKKLVQRRDFRKNYGIDESLQVSSRCSALCERTVSGDKIAKRLTLGEYWSIKAINHNELEYYGKATRATHKLINEIQNSVEKSPNTNFITREIEAVDYLKAPHVKADE